MIYVALAIFQPYRDLYTTISEIVPARPGIEPGPLAPQTKSLTITPPLFLKGKHAFNVIVIVIGFSLLDKGHEANNLQ